MNEITNIFDWLAGGDTPYMSLRHCMRDDEPWLWTNTLLRLSIVVAYLLIGTLWLSYKARTEDTLERRLLTKLILIFVSCSICGYGFQVVAVWWPGYRLLTALLALLNVVSWRFVLRAIHADPIRLAKKE